MLALDLRSLSAMSGLMAVVLGLVLFGVRANFPESIRGLRLWGLAPLLCASSTVLFVLHGVLPAWSLVLGGNGLLMAGFACFLFGSQRFAGVPVSWRPWGAVIAAALGLMAVFLWVLPDYRMRVLIFTSTLALICVFHVRLLLRHCHGFASRLIVGVLSAQALILLARGVSSLWLDSPTSDRFAPSLVQTAYLAAFSFAVLLVSVGVLLMASERLRSEFEHLATHDGLTGAFTRRAALQMADAEMQRWLRQRQPFAVLMMDADHFKQINDVYGHLVGDTVLHDIAAQVIGALRATDRLGRFGGEEFVAVLPATDLAAAVAVAERVVASVRSLPVLPDRPRCTVSVGVAAVQADDARFDQVLGRADAALYLAKNRGRDQVAIHASVAPVFE